MPRPCAVSATTTSVGLGVGQKMRQTPGTGLSVFRMLLLGPVESGKHGIASNDLQE